MNIKRLFAVLIPLFLVTSCSKNEITPVKVTYAVRAAFGSTLRISYNSDYYFDSGNRKPVDITATGGYWVATHLAEEPEDYYIRVDYLDSAGSETNYRVYVVFNDSLFIDSAIFQYSVPVVELQGQVIN